MILKAYTNAKLDARKYACGPFSHYSDVMTGAMASLITGVSIASQPFVQVQIKENIKAPRHWPMCGELTGDR